MIYLYFILIALSLWILVGFYKFNRRLNRQTIGNIWKTPHGVIVITNFDQSELAPRPIEVMFIKTGTVTYYAIDDVNFVEYIGDRKSHVEYFL